MGATGSYIEHCILRIVLCTQVQFYISTLNGDQRVLCTQALTSGNIQDDHVYVWLLSLDDLQKLNKFQTLDSIAFDGQG